MVGMVFVVLEQLELLEQFKGIVHQKNNSVILILFKTQIMFCLPQNTKGKL